MKTKSEVFTEYFWKTFDTGINFKEYLSVSGKKWSKLKEKKKLKGYSNE